MNDFVYFHNILTPRRTKCGIFKFMTRECNPQKTMIQGTYHSPQELKTLTLNSLFMHNFIEAESMRTGICKQKLRQEVEQYLEEMAFDRVLPVIRWMGVFFLKISFMMNVGIYVNEPSVLQLKKSMGSNPVLFLPTHRSYADFCLMTYLCYHYDIEFPAVAAGMDFYSMALVGRSMRDTGAFYIRRTLTGAPLYAATLKQYVRTVVAEHSAPIEFFVEGTRSRSNKCLPPKYGMLSMSLLPYFTREVSDITIVPVNISYDRLIEHGLFAYEHIGVPKPKESTGGLLKALGSLNDNYGDIYINLGIPLSVEEYFQDSFQKNEMLKPKELQQITTEQFRLVQKLADHIVTLQQQCTVASISNIIAIILMQSLLRNKPLTLEEVKEEMEWVMNVLRNLGALVFVDDLNSGIEKILVVHKKIMCLDKQKTLRLLSSPLMDISSAVKMKMKGHKLKAETMVVAVPIIQLQLYVNPVLHYLVPPALIYLIVRRGNVTHEQLSEDYIRLRKLLRHEFFYTDNEEKNVFQKASDYCIQNDVIQHVGGMFVAGGGESRQLYLFKWSLLPMLTTLLQAMDVMIEQIHCEHKQILKEVQKRAESTGCHPYCLSLESANNCLQGLAYAGALIRDQGDEVRYRIVPEMIQKCRLLVNSILPHIGVSFDKNNSVIIDRLISRL